MTERKTERRPKEKREKKYLKKEKIYENRTEKGTEKKQKENRKKDKKKDIQKDSIYMTDSRDVQIKGICTFCSIASVFTDKLYIQSNHPTIHHYIHHNHPIMYTGQFKMIISISINKDRIRENQ